VARLAWVFRAAIVGTAAGHFVQGQILYALFCVAAVIVVMVPAYAARTSRVNLPVEVELVLLWWLVADMALGRLGGLYDTTVWFDKALHLGNSILLGMVAFLAVYVLHFTYKTANPAWIDGVAILLVTLGLGAVWEIAEYVSDLVFRKGAQGSPLLGPLDDTMWDLIFDGIGGAIGGVLGPIYMRRSKRSRIRAEAFASYVATRLASGERLSGG
jgi:hypothetical protein